MTPGKALLSIVPTPLGNLGDITLRAADLLRRARFVACEDTRVTSKLLNHLGSEAKLISIREENEESGARRIIDLLENGEEVAYCTDAGTPGVSDPGARLVARVRSAGFVVSALPGPSAVTTALAASGLPADNFHFTGFLPAKSSARRKALLELKSIHATLVLFESPHRARDLLCEAAEILGDRRVSIGRELTKLHEEIFTTSLLEAAKREEWRGELTIVIEGAKLEEKSIDPDELNRWLGEELARAEYRGLKEIAKRAAEELGVSQNEAYAAALAIKEARAK